MARYVLPREVVWDLHEAKADQHHDNVKVGGRGGAEGAGRGRGDGNRGGSGEVVSDLHEAKAP